MITMYADESRSTVLNLPTEATKEEIRDRYRQLSLVFHPDKQHGKPTQETALKRFLEVQKAYESEPLPRVVRPSC